MSDWSLTLDALVRERGPALFGYAYVLTGSATRAEDLLQDALLRTFRSGRATRDLNSAHAYVKRAITSAFIDQGRREATRPRMSDAGEGSPEGVAEDVAGQVGEAADLHRALLTLPPRERACVVLRYLEDMPVASVAAELGIAVGSVKRYLSDGLCTPSHAQSRRRLLRARHDPGHGRTDPMNTAHDLLDQLRLDGATRFAETDLAHGHTKLTRRVRRDRAVRTSVLSVAGLAVVGAAAVGVGQLSAGDAAPAANPNPPSATARAVVATVNVAQEDTAAQITEAFAAALGVSADEAKSALVDALPAEAGGSIDGWIIPGEYSFRDSETPAEAAKQMVLIETSYLESLDLPRAQWHDTVVLASILQAESAVLADQPSIARVLINRIDAGMPLQVDSVPRSYVKLGLPVSGVGAPTHEAIGAAANPANGDWLYFLRKPDGNVLLFTEYADFETAVLAQNAG